MARQLPQRTDTPMTDGGPPSSDPPSSGTAPSVSSPPTPKDQSTLQSIVDPAFIDPALLDLPDSSSEPVFAHQYLRYAEGLEKDIEDQEIEGAHTSVPPTGFVQRVKAMLESKAAADTAARRDADREKLYQHEPIHEDIAELDIHDEEELHELAANETPRFTVIEEYEAPVELPASPVRLPELAGSPVQPRRRITREMVKAGLRPSSVDESGHTDDTETTSIDMIIKHKPSQSHDTARTARSAEETKPVQKEVPSTPGTVEMKVQEDSRSDSASSPGALGLSVADYAIRFDTTAMSEETQSKDPFVLDADTITLQHQRSKEKMTKPEPQAHAKDDNVDVPLPEVPVSPILTGEEVSRCSAVSPMQTQTLGIEETLAFASEPTQDETSTSEEQTMPGAFPEEMPPPATPKTPKTYSKSVQVHPTTAMTDTPSSNRFSLPPDLSTVGDTTMNSNSDMITDVAVRFSLPQTTITISKPQIVEIPPNELAGPRGSCTKSSEASTACF